jgi:hypothetical protein
LGRDLVDANRAVREQPSREKFAVTTTTVAPTPVTSASYGVQSEVGVLRKVLVCAPGLAHSRLTPRNCDDLLFDDVLRVDNARRDHFDFINKMRDPRAGHPALRQGTQRAGPPSCAR